MNNILNNNDMVQEEKIWSIKDAKAGEVLANDHHILILKELNYDWWTNIGAFVALCICVLQQVKNVTCSLPRCVKRDTSGMVKRKS